MDYGTVITAQLPAIGNRFVERKNRTLIIVGSYRGYKTAIAGTNSQAKRKHLVPNPHNGIWKPVDLITNIRWRLLDPQRFEVVGHLTASEIIGMRKLLRSLAVDQIYNLR